jgi:hypothetical protein
LASAHEVKKNLHERAAGFECASGLTKWSRVRDDKALLNSNYQKLRARLSFSQRRLTEHIDTTSPAGRMLLEMLGAFAEFERSMVGNGPVWDCKQHVSMAELVVGRQS